MGPAMLISLVDLDQLDVISDEITVSIGYRTMSESRSGESGRGEKCE